MNPLVPLLVDLTAELLATPGVSPDAIRLLRIALAAALLRDNPGLAEVDVTDLDPWIGEAISEGLARADVLRQAGTTLRVARDEIPLGSPFEVPSERPTAIHGPFVDRDGQLVRFLEFESAAFISVRLTLAFAGGGGPAWLLIPAASQPDADSRVWTLPSGTVWIEASQLVANIPGFTGLRIAGGELRINQPAPLGPRGIILPLGAAWSLSLTPEQPAGGDPKGSDADSLQLTLPAQIEIRSGLVSAIAGDVSLDGFGSALSFVPIVAAPTIDRGHVCFPLDASGLVWSIAGNRSRVIQFSGECPVDRPCYALPIVNPLPIAPAEALHGGSVIARIQPSLTSVLTAQSGGPSRWFDATVTANAAQIEIDALQVDSRARYDVTLWSGVTTRFRFAQQPISRLLFRSNRDGRDAAAVLGGHVRNRWDVPRRADGQPFGFEGTIGVFALLADASGSSVVCLASAPPAGDFAGFALENVYLRVRSPGRLALFAHGAGVQPGESGIAVLSFDAAWALPTLPDPYAWNLQHTDLGGPVERALRVVLRWEPGAAAAIAAHLDQPIGFPEPPLDQPRNDDEARLRGRFMSHLRSEHESFRLLDLSSREHLFGVALERSFDQRPSIVDNRLTVALRQIRLLMQPQVQWEPVADVTGPLRSVLNGGPTLAGAHSVKLVPVLPGVISTEIPEAIKARRPAAALFSLPFGLRAMVRLSPPEMVRDLPSRHGVVTTLHEPSFDSLRSVRQLRLQATGAPDVSRQMPGTLVQLANLAPGPLTSVLPGGTRNQLNQDFDESVPLHHADLSGHGLSTFSEWSEAKDIGIIKAHFHVLNGRTAYEVIQEQSICWPSQARFVRTIILERHNSGTVVRTDSGWDAVTPGLYNQWIPFEKGVVKGLHNIRRIRITGPEEGLTLGESSVPGVKVVVQPVLFDADAEFEDVVAGGSGGRVPVFDQVGYVQQDPDLPFAPQDLRQVFEKFGAIGGPVNCRIRAGKTIEMQLLHVLADLAPTDGNGTGFAVAAYGLPKLPRAGQWSAVRIDPATLDATPIDPRRGTPISRFGAGPYHFREAADVRRTPKTQYGFLMATETSRALFPQPRIDAAQPGKLFSDKPVLADPYSLCQASGAFPRPSFALRAHQSPVFDVAADDNWKIQNPDFTFDKPLADLLKGGEWAMSRVYDNLPLRLNVDSAIPLPWDVNVPPSNLDIDIPPFGKIMTIRTRYIADSAGLPKLDAPDLLFSGALEELKKTLDALQALIKLPFHVNVTVTAAGSGSLSFIVRIQLRFRIAEGPNERIDIGLGKFYGEFLISGELEASPSGVKRGRLLAQFTGDLQQGVLPPLLYAGGLFRFAVEIRDTGRPLIELTFAAVVSVGGDLVKGLIEVEVTIKYGYSLIPETLQPGVLLGLEVRAKLLGGLVGFSFAAEVMARLARANLQTVTIRARIRVVATVQVAYFFEDDVDFETEFEQKLPLGAVALVAGANPLAVAAHALL